MCEPSHLSFPAAGQFLILHGDLMSPLSVQLSSSFDILHVMSSSSDVLFAYSYAFDNESEQQRGRGSAWSEAAQPAIRTSFSLCA